MIVFPMAGASRRFAEAGYKEPKFMLPLRGSTVFEHAVGGFSSLFPTRTFLFVMRREPGARAFVEAALGRLGVQRWRIAELEASTRGQAETVAAGLDEGTDTGEPLTVFNIDTFRPDYHEPPVVREPGVAGYLEVFRGEGANWSYVEPDPERPGRVLRTAEKQPISDLCCTGLYHFVSASVYLRAYEAELAAPQSHELFVAPMYNHLICRGEDVRYVEVARTDVVFCGVPEEYEALL